MSDLLFSYSWFSKRVPLQGQTYNLQSFSSKAQNGGFLFNVDRGRHCEMVRSPMSNEYLKWLFYSCLHVLVRFVSQAPGKHRFPWLEHTTAHHLLEVLGLHYLPPGALLAKLENQKDPECSRSYLLAIFKLSHSGSDALHKTFCVLMTSKQKQNWGAKGKRGGTGRRRKWWLWSKMFQARYILGWRCCV